MSIISLVFSILFLCLLAAIVYFLFRGQTDGERRRETYEKAIVEALTTTVQIVKDMAQTNKRLVAMLEARGILLPEKSEPT